MANNIEPAGNVVLRGVVVAVNSDVGQAFVIDCVRHIEDLLDANQLRVKYGLTDEETWQALETNNALQLAIAAMKERRIRDGTAQREKAARHWLTAVDVVNAIVQDPTAPSRARLDGARELRACAVPAAETNTPASDRYVINISFASHKVHKTVDLTPRPPEPDDDEYQLPAPRVTGLIIR
jgi:hypothetical protein